MTPTPQVRTWCVTACDQSGTRWRFLVWAPTRRFARTNFLGEYPCWRDLRVSRRKACDRTQEPEYPSLVTKLGKS